MADPFKGYNSNDYGGRTEWEDQMIRLGHMSAKQPTVTEDDIISMIDSAAKEYTREPTKEEILENATLDDLDDLEDDEDDKILEMYRQKRLAEMKVQATRNRYGTIIEIKAPQWKGEVTDAPADLYVVIHLYKSGVPQCQTLNNCLVVLAHQHKDVKFLKAVSDETIPNYPDKNVPTILIYKKGDIVCQMIGLLQMGGTNKTLQPEELDYQIGKLGGCWRPAESKPVRNFKLQREYHEKYGDDDDY